MLIAAVLAPAWLVFSQPSSGASPPVIKGGNCTGAIAGPLTIQGDVNVPPGANCAIGWVPPSTTPCCNPPFPSNNGPVRVNGNVKVGKGASFTLGLNSVVTHNLTADGCTFVELVSEGNEEVDGDVHVTHCTGGLLGGPAFQSSGSGTAIHGNFECQSNTASCDLEGATVGHDAHVNGNASAVSAFTLAFDKISGNLECKENKGWCDVVGATVGHDVHVENNVGMAASTISYSTITGNLECQKNVPPPVGGGTGDVVHGHEQGQCAGF